MRVGPLISAHNLITSPVEGKRVCSPELHRIRSKVEQEMSYENSRSYRDLNICLRHLNGLDDIGPNKYSLLTTTTKIFPNQRLSCHNILESQYLSFIFLIIHPIFLGLFL